MELEVPAAFASRKRNILAALAAPAEEYLDRSPKGSVDAEIRELIDFLNSLDGVVTTSSCAGRVSLFVEGNSSSNNTQPSYREAHLAQGLQTDSPAAATSKPTKGLGGRWLFVTHDGADLPQLEEQLASFGLHDLQATAAAAVSSRRSKHETIATDPNSTSEIFSASGYESDTSESQLIRLQFEPMILHIQCASLAHGHPILAAAQSAGWRESGMSSLPQLEAKSDPRSPQQPGTTRSSRGHGFPLVAVRSTGLALGSVVGHVGATGTPRFLVSTEYISFMVGCFHQRFARNQERIQRFQGELLRRVSLEVARPLGRRAERSKVRAPPADTALIEAKRAARQARQAGSQDADPLSLYDALDTLDGSK